VCSSDLGIGSTSDCSCGCSCPAGASCQCPACDCTSQPTSSATCERNCNETVQKILDKIPDCDGVFLSLLDCVASAACPKNSNDLCKAEQDAFQTCDEQAHAVTPPSTTGPTTPGAISCRGGIGGSAASGPGGFQPGEVICQGMWDACTDGNTYQLQCQAMSAAGDVACVCSVGGVLSSSFSAASCEAATSDATSQCGWNIQ